MSSEATSALTFGDLVLEIALKMGTAYYGEDGDEPAQIPVEEHDRTLAKQIANNAVRMFLADAPPTGWRWTRPVAGLALWADLGVTATRTVTGGAYDAANDQTLITANSSIFFETMEEKDIVVTGHGTLVVKQYVSPTMVYVYGSHYFAAASTYSIASEGDFTLPRSFAGSYTGALNYAAGTNRATGIEWSNDARIRYLRENTSAETGWPTIATIRIRSAQSGRRRFEMCTYPTPNETLGLELTFDLNFDKMVSFTETLPTPVVHDETLRAACLAVVERDVDDAEGSNTTYYRDRCLPNSYNADARSGPRKLGYFGNGAPKVGMNNFRDYLRRPNVSYQ